HLSSTCTSTRDGSSGSAYLAGVTISGTPVAASPGANTVVDIPGVLRAVLNEQAVDDAPGSTAIVVRAIDLQVLPDNHGRAAIELILAESRCGTTGSSAGNIPSPAGTPATPGTPAPGGGPGLPTPGAVMPAVPAGPSGTATPAPSGPSVPSGSSGPSAPSATQPAPPSQAAPAPAPGSALPATSSAPVISPQQGPPGAEIRVVAAGYSSCPLVGVSFNGIRIGAARPDATGRVDQGGLSIPGDAAPGRHSVATACLS